MPPGGYNNCFLGNSQSWVATRLRGVAAQPGRPITESGADVVPDDLVLFAGDLLAVA